MPKSSPKILEARKATYLDRKLRQVCIDCETDLEDGDGARCTDCTERDKASKAVYNRSAKGKRVNARRARKRARDHARRGLCRICNRKRKRGSKICQRCRDRQTAAQQRYRARKAQGIVVLATERRKRKAAELEEKKAAARELARRRSGRDYTPIEAILESSRYRMLAAVERFDDWITASELLDAIGVPGFDEDDRTERDRFTKTLERLRKAGLIRYRSFHEAAGHRMIRARGSRNGGDYRITTRGRDELAELRAAIARGIAC